MKTFNFENHELSRVFKGNWQLSGGHGEVHEDEAVDVLLRYTERGVNAFDVGDIYGNSEAIIGKFLNKYKEQTPLNNRIDLRVHTKFVPDLDALTDLDEKDIRRVIERSLERLQLQQLHLVQFHWWDFELGNHIEAAKFLQKLKNEGLIESIGVTNCDTVHLAELLEAGVEVVSNQVQFSLIDPRPLNKMLEFAKTNNIAIFCYGTLAGGLLASTKVIDEPTNRSHVKYKLIIEEAGQDYYGRIIKKLDSLSKKYNTSLANVAAAFVLQVPGVSSVILGPRNGRHVMEVDVLGDLLLDQQDYDELFGLLSELNARMQDDVYSYERRLNGAHGKIMKYNLNGMRA